MIFENTTYQSLRYNQNARRSQFVEIVTAFPVSDRNSGPLMRARRLHKSDYFGHSQESVHGPGLS